MGLVYFVKKQDGERFFLHGVRELTSGAVTDISGRRSEQPLVGMALLVLAHIETDNKILISEYQFRNCLCQFRLVFTRQQI